MHMTKLCHDHLGSTWLSVCVASGAGSKATLLTLLRLAAAAPARVMCGYDCNGTPRRYKSSVLSLGRVQLLAVGPRVSGDPRWSGVLQGVGLIRVR